VAAHNLRRNFWDNQI